MPRPAIFDLKKQLVTYGAHHNNKINVAIHMVFVPVIFWTGNICFKEELGLLNIHALIFRSLGIRCKDRSIDRPQSASQLFPLAKIRWTEPERLCRWSLQHLLHHFGPGCICKENILARTP